MKALGTTGTRDIPESERAQYIDYLRSPEMEMWLHQFSGFISGACIGWDALFGEEMVRMFPDRYHLVVVPFDRSRVNHWWHRYDLGLVRVLNMGDGTTYKERNQKIVDLSTDLYYMAKYPEHYEKSLRSGTWQCVRMARKKGIVPFGHVIHNDKEMTND